MKQRAKLYKQELRILATPAELLFKEFLENYKFNFAFQDICHYSKDKRFYILDFVIKMNPKTIIELDGSSHTGRQKIDQQRTDYILKHKKYSGFVLLRFTNKQVYNGQAQNYIVKLYPKQIAKYI